jgi:hypothetical protein
LNYEENHAEGYDENGKSLGPQRRLMADAAGSMKTTPRDFALFLHLRGHPKPANEGHLKTSQR